MPRRPLPHYPPMDVWRECVWKVLFIVWVLQSLRAGSPTVKQERGISGDSSSQGLTTKTCDCPKKMGTFGPPDKAQYYILYKCNHSFWVMFMERQTECLFFNKNKNTFQLRIVRLILMLILITLLSLKCLPRCLEDQTVWLSQWFPFRSQTWSIWMTIIMQHLCEWPARINPLFYKTINAESD